MTFKKDSILTGFRECKLVSYNPVIVLEKIKEYQAPPSSNPLSRLSTLSEAQIWPSITSLTTRSLKKQVIQLQNTTPSRQKALQEKFIKGVLIQTKAATQVRKDLVAFTTAEQERKE